MIIYIYINKYIYIYISTIDPILSLLQSIPPIHWPRDPSALPEATRGKRESMWLPSVNGLVFLGKSRENRGFSQQIWGFPVAFPLPSVKQT